MNNNDLEEGKCPVLHWQTSNDVNCHTSWFLVKMIWLSGSYFCLCHDLTHSLGKRSYWPPKCRDWLRRSGAAVLIGCLYHSLRAGRKGREAGPEGVAGWLDNLDANTTRRQDFYLRRIPHRLTRTDERIVYPAVAFCPQRSYPARPRAADTCPSCPFLAVSIRTVGGRPWTARLWGWAFWRRWSLSSAASPSPGKSSKWDQWQSDPLPSATEGN